MIFHLDNEVLVNFYEVLNAANIFRKHVAILNASDVDWRDKKSFYFRLTTDQKKKRNWYSQTTCCTY